jgi:hypothetical protein
VDTSGATKDAKYIADLFIDAIKQGGRPLDVVSVIMDNASACAAAGLLVEAEFPHITSIGCTAHSLDLALKSIGKLPWAAKVIAEGKSVTKFITNHQWALALQRAKSKVEGASNLELLKPGTRQMHMQFV